MIAKEFLSTFHNKMLLCITVVLLFTSVSSSSYDDEFHEELVIKPLPSGHVYSYFQFTTKWNVDYRSETFHHCNIFPKSLGEIVSRYKLQELHLSLTEGLWRHEYWGYPVLDAPPGAEVWAWFKDDAKDIDKLWKELTGALSGLLCASLNFIDKSNSLSPQYSFKPSGIVGEKGVNSSHVRFATLPREIVCTENLTPWKKLLPCDSKRGLATLLNAGHIYNTNYHSLGLHFRPVCKDTSCLDTSVELRQTVSLVYDMVIVNPGKQDWSVRKLFGIGLHGSCPLASSSKIFVDLSTNETGNIYQLSPNPTKVITSIRGGFEYKLAVYDVKQLVIEDLMNIAAVYSSPRVYTVNTPPVLYANRYIIGSGQERGGVVTKLHNTHWSALNVVFLENIPWFLPVYLHTLRIVSNGKEIKPILKKYIPGKERVRPYHLEVLLQLPARSVTEISIEFDYVFLKWQEYPPDANHGFYVGAAVISALLPTAKNYIGLPQDGSTFSSSFNASRDGYFIELRTETIIIALPTPDFSMPYNVICLACTVVALAFGPLHNITTKRLRLKTCEQESGLKQRIKSLISFRKKSKQQSEKLKTDEKELT